MVIFNGQRKSICSTLLKMHALLAMHAPCDYVHANQLNGSTSRVQRGGKKQTVADFSKWHHLPFIIQYKGKPPPSKGDESYAIVTPVRTHWQRFNRTNMSKTILQCDYISMLTHFFFFLKCRKLQIPRHCSSRHCPLVELWEELMTWLQPLPSGTKPDKPIFDKLKKSFA